MSDDPPVPAPRRKLDVRVSDEQRPGTYANMLIVSHGPHEFTLDFSQIHPQGEGGATAEVVSRIRIAPTMVAQVLQALNTNLSNYEDRFGPVKALG